MNTTPYFTNPNAMKSLGKRLFKVAVELSRLDDRSDIRVKQAIRAVKGRKLIYFKRAVHEVTELRNDMIVARRDRHYRKAGRTVVDPYYIAPEISRFTREHCGPFRHAHRVKPLSERLEEYKNAKSQKIEDQHLSALGHFERACRPHHHVEFTLTDDPADVSFEGHSSRTRHHHCRIWTQTQSHWKVTLPRDWWEQVRWMHMAACKRHGIAVLNCDFLKNRVINAPSARWIYGDQDVIEEHYAVRIARQRRGFRITTEDGYIVVRSLTMPNRSLRRILRYGQTIEQAIANVDKEDYYVRDLKFRKSRERREKRERQLSEALETLKLVQSGHIGMGVLNEREKLDLLRAVQHQIANAQKRTATFGGIGQRAIHAEPHCAAA